MTRSPGALIAYWNRRAPSYDETMSGAERRFLGASRRWVCSRARGATLEIAVGTGANFAHYPDEVVLTGVDWSEAMLAVAREQAERVRRRVDLRQADASALPFSDGSFDTVACTFALCCIPDPRAALAEAVRVLRPGGDLLLADHIGSTFWPLRALQYAVELVSVPLQGEHYTRRPLAMLADLPAGAVEIVETDRVTLGAFERVHVRRAPARSAT